MPDNDFWIGQEQIPVDLSLLLTYSNDEDYWYAPGGVCAQGLYRRYPEHQLRPPLLRAR